MVGTGSLDGGDGDDYVNVVNGQGYGGDGSDHLYGYIGPNWNSGVEVLDGGAADDFIDAGYGDDTVFGGSGDDVVTGSQGNDKLFGGSGYDKGVYSGNIGAYVMSAIAADGAYTITGTDYLITGNADGSVTVQDLRAGSPDGAASIPGARRSRLRRRRPGWRRAGRTPPGVRRRRPGPRRTGRCARCGGRARG